MTAKEAIEKVGAIVKGVFSQAKFESAKLSDGTSIEYSALEAGGDISIIADDGTKAPAPVGDYELEDGKIVVVAEEGKIAEVKEAAPKEGEEAMADEEPIDKPAIDWSEEIKDLKRSLAWQAQRIASLQNAMQTFKAGTGEMAGAFMAFMEAVAAEEKEGAITTPKQTVFSEIRKNTEEARAKALAAYKAFAEKAKKK